MHLNCKLLSQEVKKDQDQDVIERTKKETIKGIVKNKKGD